MEINFSERQAGLEEAQEVARRVAECTEPAAMVRRVCDHLPLIIAIQKQEMNL